MTIFKILDQMEQAIASAPSLIWPFAGRCVLNRERLISLIEKTRSFIPEEFHHAKAISEQADKVIRESRQISKKKMEQAQINADDILKKAQEKALKMVTESEIVKSAREKANDIIERAKNDANKIKEDAEKNRDEILSKAKSEADEIRNNVDSYVNKLFGKIEVEAQKIIKIAQENKSNNEQK